MPSDTFQPLSMCASNHASGHASGHASDHASDHASGHTFGTPASEIPASASDRADKIRDAALALGFQRIGFSPIEPAEPHVQALQTWIKAGYHGEMAYMAEPGRQGSSTHVWGPARTVIVVALAYSKKGPQALSQKTVGYIARYARGADYHAVFRSKLQALASACERIVGRAVEARACVDSAPLLERSYAAQAGVGFIAKSTLAIVPGLGSHVLLGELLLDVALAPSTPIKPRCGRCTACLVACPTGAFVSPYVLDARKCIAYLTIELRGPIPRHLRALIGNMVFGCDICQDVCPFNASPKQEVVLPELSARPELTAPDLIGLLNMGSAAYRKWVKATALRRISRKQMARNAAVALGNCADTRAIGPLIKALFHHTYPLVRGHAAWALGRLGALCPASAFPALSKACSDPDSFVQQEAQLALHALYSNDAHTGA